MDAFAARPSTTSRGYLRTFANQASLELSELLFIGAKGCGSGNLFPTIKEACRELHPLSTQ